MTPLLIRNIGSLVTNASDEPGVLDIVEGAAVAIADGAVEWVGPESKIPAGLSDRDELDASGRAVLPGFVDAHTHLVFGGDRADEFAARLEGAGYEEILAAGGGIHSTVDATRTASEEELVDSASDRARRMLRSGTTTVEVKSGYGLTVESEVRSLRVADRLSESVGIGVIPTFLAHLPDRGVHEREQVARVVEEILPAVGGLAEFCDVFVDRGAFGVDSARTIFEAAARQGLAARLHAEQLTHTGASLLAAELGAASADHLDHASAQDAAALAAAGVAAVLLPGVSLSMRIPPPPTRTLWDAGVTVALATDCNPGTSYVESMPLMVALGSLQLGLTPDEAVWAATRGGARSVRRDDLGCVRPGARGDLVVLDAPSHRHLVYRPGTNLVWGVVKDGTVVE